MGVIAPHPKIIQKFFTIKNVFFLLNEKNPNKALGTYVGFLSFVGIYVGFLQYKNMITSYGYNLINIQIH